MTAGIILVVSIIVLVFLLLIVFFVCYYRTKRFLKNSLGCSTISEAFQKTKNDLSNTPKSFSSMESLLINQVKRDFPEISLSQLKRKSETCIIDLFLSVERKNTSVLNKYSDKIVNYALKMIEDFKDVDVSYDNLKFHKTALTDYKHNDAVATITIASSLEYIIRKGDSVPKKVQDRIKVDMVYVLDRDKYGEYTKSVGFNCPNCGAPVENLGDKKCSYCGSALLVVADKVWFVDNLNQF